MTDQELEQLKYPIGKFVKPNEINEDHIDQWISEIQEFPILLKELTNKLNNDQKNWTYRPGGWNIKQIIHHCGDSHLNSFMRFKLSLTENEPVIKPYFEDRWAKLPDSNYDEIEDSLMLIHGLHNRWTVLLKSLSKEELKKEFVHPEHGKKFSLEENIGVYAHHGNHHLAHIENAIKFKGKFDG